MAEWRFHLIELPSRTWIDRDLPLSGAQVIRGLSVPASISGSLPLGYASIRRADGTLALREWGYAVIAEQDGQEPVMAIVDDVALGTDEVDISAGGFSMYPTDMPWLGEEFTGVKVDPLDMVRKIWDHLQSYPGGNLNVTVDALRTPEAEWIGEPLKDVNFTTGAGEDVSFEAGPFRLASWTTDNLGQTISNLAESTPFEYRERSYWDGEGIAHRIELGYPKLGARRPDLRFEIGLNVIAPPPINERDYASEVWFRGAGEGRKSLETSVHLTRDTNKLRRVHVVTDKDVASKKAAGQAAQPILDDRTGEYALEAVDIVDHPSAPFSAFEPGDEILIVGDAGWIQLEHWVRILEMTDNCETGRRTLKVVTV